MPVVGLLSLASADAFADNMQAFHKGLGGLHVDAARAQPQCLFDDPGGRRLLRPGLIRNRDPLRQSVRQCIAGRMANVMIRKVRPRTVASMAILTYVAAMCRSASRSLGICSDARRHSAARLM
jgi:hypothetical protein